MQDRTVGGFKDAMEFFSIAPNFDSGTPLLA
jgi:hypothetical protein